MTTKTKSAAMRFLDDIIGDELTLGNLISTIRETDEYSQIELAKRLGISKSHLCDIEKGRKVVSPERAARFADELGFSSEQFVRLALQQLLADAHLPFRVTLSRDGGRAHARQKRPTKRVA